MRENSESTIDTMRQQASMTREEREHDIERRQKIVDGMLRWINEDKREPTQRESEQIQHQRNVIASLKLGLEREREGAE